MTPLIPANPDGLGNILAEKYATLFKKILLMEWGMHCVKAV